MAFGQDMKAYPMLKLKKMFRSDLFWSLSGGFAIGAVAMLNLSPSDSDLPSYAQHGPANLIDQS